MNERVSLARDNSLPRSVLLDVSKTYTEIAEKITGRTIHTSQNPKEQIIAVLRKDYGIIDDNKAKQTHRTLPTCGDLELSELTAISPMDGRYRRCTKDIAEYYSEFGLIRYRTHVEIEYFLALMELLPVGKCLPAGSAGKLRAIVDSLTIA